MGPPCFVSSRNFFTLIKVPQCYPVQMSDAFGFALHRLHNAAMILRLRSVKRSEWNLRKLTLTTRFMKGN